MKAQIGLFFTLMPLSCFAAGWSTSLNSSNPNLLQIFYTNASGATYQYAVLDESSAYLRLVYGPTAGWGTSVDVMPCFWSGGTLYQGYPITMQAATSGADYVLNITGTEHGLTTKVKLTIVLPTATAIAAFVTAATSGSVTLDTDHQHEAFKPVFLSSMHDSATVWDSQYPFSFTPYPSSGWIYGPEVANGLLTTEMGLEGGTSSWKKNAPTIEILWSGNAEVAGWVTADTNPNDDNVGYWVATSIVPASWSYEISCH